jgi:hypothetical protein
LTGEGDLAYFPPAMSFRRIRVFFTLALLSSSATLSAQTSLPSADGGAIERRASLVILRNGEILEGQIQSTKNDRVTVCMPRGEISLRQAEVDVIADNLDDAYALKLTKIPPTDVESHLDLAAWCIRHGLLGSAATELSTAMSIQPRHPRIAIIHRRLQQTIEQQQTAQGTELPPEPETRTAESPSAKPRDSQEQQAQRNADESSVWPPRTTGSLASKNDAKQEKPRREAVDQDRKSIYATSKRVQPRDTITEIERLVRTLPTEAVESFTSVAQPILVNGCATTGCHAPGNTTTFTLLRLPANRPVSRRLTQRNLYNVVQLVDFKRPADSSLFKMAKEPHGPLKTPALGEAQSAYRELVQWVAALTRSNLDELVPADTVEQKQAVAEAKPAAGPPRQSLMRRMRAPSVSGSHTPRAPIVQPPIKATGPIIKMPTNAPTTAEANRQSHALVAHEEQVVPTSPNVNQAGLIIGAPPPSTPATSTATVPHPLINGQTPPHELPSPQTTTQLGPAPAQSQSPKIRAPNPNGITAVDRFRALRGAPRVAKEIQSAPKAPPAGKGGVKQQPPPTEPDPYDLMRFVKEK